MTGRGAAVSAALALILPCVLQAAPSPSRESLKYRDFEDMVRCRFILEEVCARLEAGDRDGASVLIVGNSSFDSLPGDQGPIRSCRRIRPSQLMSIAKRQPQMSLLLGYDSKSTQEVGLRFGGLGRWTCGFIAAVDIGPREFRKKGKAYYDFSIQWNERADGSADWIEGGKVGPESGRDILASLKPERDDSPRAAYIGRVLEEIRAERERREAETDPLNRPLIQKE